MPGVARSLSSKLLAGVSAIALLPLICAAAASAQTVTPSGAVSPVIGPGSTSVGNLFVGVAAGANGSVAIDGGGTLDVSGNASIGVNQGTGNIVLTGSGSTFSVGGRLDVGQQGGSGSITVNTGTALVTSGLGNTNVQIGGVACCVGSPTGGDGTITVNGGSVSIQRSDGRPFLGIAQHGTGSLAISNGGTVTIGTAASGTGAADTFGAGINVGGQTPNPGGGYPSGTTGQGSITVTGAGSALDVQGQGTYINLGRYGAGSTGTLSVLDGGKVSSFSVTVGREAGATGTVLVEGTGSLIDLKGQSSPGATPSTPGMTLGQAGASGTVTARNGGSIVVDASTATALGGGFTIGASTGGTGTMNVETGGSVTITGSPLGGGGFNIGSVAGATGTLNIAGGQVVEHTVSGGGATVGRLGAGTLNITNGGSLVINDQGSGAGVSFGGNATSLVGGVPAGGTFVGLISGAGSTLTVNGTDTVFQVGRNAGSSGTVTVAAGATVNADVAIVGRETGSSGTLNVTGTGTTVNLVGETAGTTGAGFSVGRAGTGSMTVGSGALVAIDGSAVLADANPANNNVGFFVGGSSTAQGGTGSLTVTGANSRVTVTGNGANGNATQVGIGRDNTGTTATSGTVLVENGGRILLDADARMSVGHSGLGTGTLTVTGFGAQVVAGAFLGVGVNKDGGTVNTGGTGTLNVANGGLAQASDIHIGAQGTMNSSGDGPGTAGGTLKGAVTVAGTANFANSLSVGTTTGNVQGALTILAGGTVNQQGALNGGTQVGGGPGDSGVVNVQGGTLNALNSVNGQAFIGVATGNNTGTLNVTNGGQVTIGTAASGTLAGNAFGAGMNIGGGFNAANPAASTSGTGSVLVSGAGSRIDVLGDGSYIGVGRHGSTSTGTLTVQDGGQVTTGALNIGRGNGAGANGSTGTVIVDGAGSKVTVDRKGSPGGTPPNSTPGGTIGQDQGNGTLTVRNAANVTVDASASPAVGGGFTVGALAGTGTLNVQSGASLNITGGQGGGGGLTVGATGGTGTVNVDGAGTTVTIGGVSTVASSPGMTAGREAGSTGSINITNGASVSVTVASGNAGGMTIARDAGSTGHLAVDAASLSIQGANGGNITVGRLGHGTLSVVNGGTLTMNSATGIGSGISLGGDGGSGTGGTFVAAVSGAGSSLNVTGTDAGLSIGRAAGSSGTLTISNGGTLNADVFAVARDTGSAGTLLVTGAGSKVNLTGDAGGTLGAGFAVGAGGTGSMTVSAGAVVSIDGTATASVSGLNVGGSRTGGQGGTGTLTVTGAGSAINITGNDIRMQVGYENTALSGGGKPSTGTMNIMDGGQVVLGPNGKVSVGTTAGSTGTMNVTGVNSFLNAGAFLGVGQDSDDGPGGSGHLNVTNGGTVQATVIHIGQTGLVTGTGSIIGTVYNDGIINPGNSPGVLKILGKLETGANGKIVLEIQSDGAGGFNLDSIVFEGPDAVENAKALQLNAIEFAFLDGTDPLATLGAMPSILDIDNFFKIEEVVRGVTQLVDLTDALVADGVAPEAVADLFAGVAYSGTAGGGNQAVSFGAFDPLTGTTGGITVTTVDAPEPATLALFGVGLAGLVWARRRRAA